MLRPIHERYPFLMFTEAAAEAGGGEGGATPPVAEPAKTPDGTDREEAFAARIAKEKAKWEKENADAFTKAKEYDAQIEAQKTEAQKAIDAANKERDDLAKALEDHKRTVALAQVPEDKRSAFEGKSAAEIESAIALAALLSPAEPKSDPSDGRPIPNLRIAGKPDADPTVIPAGVVIRK